MFCAILETAICKYARSISFMPCSVQNHLVHMHGSGGAMRFTENHPKITKTAEFSAVFCFRFKI
jgi:hypothetical protein